MSRQPPAESLANAQRNANYPKEHLIRIMDHLENTGNRRKQKTLGRIIERLERWQNTK